MEREDELIIHLTNIINVLESKGIISDKDSFNRCDDKISFLGNNIGNYLYLAYNNNLYNSLKKDFKIIYEILSGSIKDKDSSSDRLDVIYNYLKGTKYTSIIDGKFDSRLSIFSRTFKIIINENNKDILLEELYCIGADIYSYDYNSNDNMTSESIALFDGLLKIEVYTGYVDDTNNYHIIIYLTEDGIFKRKEVIIPNTLINLCYKIINDRVLIESEELLFIFNLLKKSLSSYLELYKLVKEIDYDILKDIMKGIIIKDIEVEKESKHGLQKIS